MKALFSAYLSSVKKASEEEQEQSKWKLIDDNADVLTQHEQALRQHLLVVPIDLLECVVQGLSFGHQWTVDEIRKRTSKVIQIYELLK
jgi:hypothetical protein